MNLPNNINKQLAQLIRDGLTPEEAAKCLQLDIQAIDMALMGMDHKKVSVSELIENFRPDAIGILIEEARHAEKSADRIKACQILLEGKGVMPEVNAAAATALMERFNQMKSAVDYIDVQEIPKSSPVEISFK